MGESARLLLQGSAGEALCLTLLLHRIHFITGHSYLAPTTDCATKVISGYFARGIIPEDPETWCEREVENYFINNSDLQANTKLVEDLLGKF
jgi:hypothetical protein